MAKTVVGLFDDFNEAQSVVRDLVDNGFRREDISMAANQTGNSALQNVGATGMDTGARTDTGEGTAKGAGTGAVVGGIAGLLVGLGALTIPGIGPIVAAGPIATWLGSTAVGAGIGAVAGGLIGALTHMGVPREEAEYYSEAVRRGGTLVIVTSPDNMVDRAVDIMNGHDAVDIEKRGQMYRQSGYTGWNEKAAPYSSDEITREREMGRTTMAAQKTTPGMAQANANEGVAIPVVEEELAVGKRQVQSGGVRIYQHVTERPVEEQVTLREEHVTVDRRPVDRPVSEADLDAFKEGTVEITEMAEEAVVAKQAHVVEEVVVNKEATQHTETVRDTVRRTDVDVEEMDTAATTGMRGFADYDTDFRNHYQTNYARSGGTYDQYSPAYRYGYDLASDTRYQGRDWNAVEADARRNWESRNEGTWDRFKDSVRYAWDRVRGGTQRAAADVSGSRMSGRSDLDTMDQDEDMTMDRTTGTTRTNSNL